MSVVMDEWKMDAMVTMICVLWGLEVGIMLEGFIECISLVGWCVLYSDMDGVYKEGSCDDFCGVCCF